MTRQFVFVGRITKEKWFDWILQSVYLLLREWVDQFIIHVYGSGDMESVLRQHTGYGTQLIYHGRVPKEQFLDQRKSYQYTLMPSKFLETFGLVALDSIALGVPVIGMKKWGVAPFILKELAVNDFASFYATMKQAIVAFDQEVWKQQSKKCLQIASDYTLQAWLTHFDHLMGSETLSASSIALVSDYAVDIGGIEHYLLRVQQQLSTQGWQVDLYGKTTCFTGLRRKIDLLVACANIWFAIRLRHIFSVRTYGLLRLHSVQRRIGRLPLLVVRWRNHWPVRAMYHDVGLIHPFPSKVYTESQLHRAASFIGYLQEWRTCLVARHRRQTPAIVIVIGKRLYSKLLICCLQKIVDIHLVPSAYLIPHFQRWVGKTAHITTFPHFVSHAREWVVVSE